MNAPWPHAVWAAADEASVVLLAMQGDDAAFGELARRRQEGLRQLLRRLCRDATLADDLAQQTLLRAWRGIRQLRAARAVGSWLRKLAVHTWLDHVRAQQPTQPLAEEPLIEPVGAALQARLDLDAALTRLAPAVRLCIVLSYHEGLSHAEISEQTGLPLGTVKSHLTRGVARLRALLGDYEAIT